MPYQIKDRIHFLSEASKILSESLDYSSTLQTTAKLIVNNFADFCLIDVLEKGEMRRVAVKVSNPKEQVIADRFYNFVPDPRNRKAIYDAAKLKKPIIIKKVTTGWIKTVSQLPEERQTVEDLRMHSLIFAPMISRKKVVGVLTVASSNPNFSYSNEDGELIDELADRAGIVIDKSRLYKEAREAIKTRDLFLSLASHELKTPITTIYVYLQLIQRNIEKNKKFDPDWVKTLLDEMVRLTKIVDELLELSRIRTGKLVYNFSEANIKEIIRRALVNFKASHQNKVKFKDELKEKDKMLVADFDKLIEVLINILDNAAKHSALEKPIEMTLGSEKDNIVIRIRDHGHGIKEKEVEKVFEGFFKTTDNTRPGMGLGLYLSKQIIDAHKGSIKIKSEEGKGTEVLVSLPNLS